MDLHRFKAGDELVLRDGTRTEVLAPTQEGQWVPTRRADGTEHLVEAHEVSAFIPAPPGPVWGERVVVMLHHIPESEEAEETYEATTLVGVPFGAVVTHSDAASPREALDGLLNSLAAFGYSGLVSVEDATHEEGMRRYDASVPPAS
jgi:hypothetical protein